MARHQETKMKIKQLEKFNATVNKIWGILLEKFPEVTSIKAKDIGFVLPQSPYPSELNHPQEPINQHGAAVRKLTDDESFFSSCVLWLMSEGFVRGSTGSGATFTSVILTEKGLSKIGATPQCIGSSKITGINETPTR